MNSEVNEASGVYKPTGFVKTQKSLTSKILLCLHYFFWFSEVQLLILSSPLQLGLEDPSSTLLYFQNDLPSCSEVRPVLC